MQLRICCLCHNKRDLISFCTDESQIHQNYIKKMIEVVVGVKFTRTILQCICVYCSVEVYNFYIFREKSQMRAEEIQEITQSYSSPTNPEYDYEPLEDVRLPSVEELKLNFVPWIKSKIPLKSSSVQEITSEVAQVPKENGPVSDPNNLKSDKVTQVCKVTTNDQEVQCDYPETQNKRIQCVPISSREKRIQCYPITINKRIQCWLTESNSDKQIQCNVTMEDKQTITNQNIQYDRTVISSTRDTQVDRDLVLSEDKQVKCDTVLTNDKQTQCSMKTRSKCTQCNKSTSSKRVQCNISKCSLVKKNKKTQCSIESNRTQCNGLIADKQLKCDIPRDTINMEKKRIQCNGEIELKTMLTKDVEVKVNMGIDGLQLCENKLEADMKEEDASTHNVEVVQLCSMNLEKMTRMKSIRCKVCNLKFLKDAYYKHRKTHLTCSKCNLHCKNLKKYIHHVNTVCDDKLKSIAVVNVTRMTLNGLKRPLSQESTASRKRYRRQY